MAKSGLRRLSAMKYQWRINGERPHGGKEKLVAQLIFRKAKASASQLNTIHGAGAPLTL